MSKKQTPQQLANKLKRLAKPGYYVNRISLYMKRDQSQPYIVFQDMPKSQEYENSVTYISPLGETYVALKTRSHWERCLWTGAVTRKKMEEQTKKTDSMGNISSKFGYDDVEIYYETWDDLVKDCNLDIASFVKTTRAPTDL